MQAETNPTAVAEKLVELANERGGMDNITVIVARFQDEQKGWLSWMRKGSKGKKE
jgi:serine/threonine protein phosphatase PrpC